MGIVYQVCNLMDYKPHSKEACAMVFGIGLVGALSLSTLPFLHNAMIIIPAFETAVGVSVNLLHYLAYSLPENFLCIAGYLLLCKFVWRVDLSKMEGMTIDFIPEEDLKFTPQVKYALIFFILFVAGMFAPNILPASIPIQPILKTIGNAGLCFILFIVWSFIKVDGKYVFDMNELGRNGVIWGMV